MVERFYLDKKEAKPLYSSVCSFCVHYTQFQTSLFSLLDSKPRLEICKAFPNGIPDEIWLGENKHLKPFKGDNGIQFKKIKNT